MEIELAVLFIGLPVLLSIWATVKIMADEFSERWQKVRNWPWCGCCL